jgi:hypothetical protein
VGPKSGLGVIDLRPDRRRRAVSRTAEPRFSLAICVSSEVKSGEQNKGSEVDGAQYMQSGE